jgi:PAS domain S-box-containing protein
MYAWNVHALPWIVVGGALYVLAAVIFSRQRASRVAVLFCSMIVLVAVWFTGFAGMLLAAHENAATMWARLALAAVCLLPAAIYDFTMTALRLYTARKHVVNAVWVLGFAFAALAAFSGAIVAGVRPHPWGFYPFVGPLTRVFLLIFFAVLVAQVVEGILEYRRTHDVQRKRRIGKLIASFIVVYFGAVDFIPMFGVEMQPVGYLPVIAFIAFAWGTIMRHRFQPITAARAARQILDTMADALFVIDAEAKIRVVNGAVRRAFGYADADLLGRSIDTLESVESDHTISRTLRELARREPIRDQERVFRDRDGHGIAVSVSISPVGQGDAQEGAVVIARDIRERKRADEELRATMKQLQQSNRELEDFAYVASHDLQEPLRKIQAFGDLLKSRAAAQLDAQARDYIERMQSAAKRMQVLINDLLAFSRVTTKAQPFVPVNLGEVARQVAHDLELRARDAGGEVVIGELPTVDADPSQMHQLLQNLASNALKFHRPGVPPRVEIRGAAMNGRAEITVSDNGIGFEEKYADRIFTMFERLHGRGQYEGTGIGLAICRKIAERHGGEIRARSVVGEGSVFVVKLPLRQMHVAEEG